jgi:cell division protease FtsH
VNDLTKNILVFIVIIVVLLSVVQGLSGVSGAQPQARDYSEFLTEVRNGEVSLVEFEGQRVRFGQREPLPYYTISPETDNSPLIGMLEKNGIRFSASEPKQQSLIGQLLISSFPILLLIGVWIYFMRQMQGGGGGRGAMSFGKSKARLLGEDQVGITFADVAGVDEAKAEVAEIVEFLKDPSKFQRLGGKIPKGVLWRCSSVSGPLAFATCSTRRRNRLPASSSSTSSTQSAVIVAPGSAVATTSVSRR